MLHDTHVTLAGGGKLPFCQSLNSASYVRRHICRGNVPMWEFPIPAWLEKRYLTGASMHCHSSFPTTAVVLFSFPPVLLLVVAGLVAVVRHLSIAAVAHSCPPIANAHKFMPPLFLFCNSCSPPPPPMWQGGAPQECARRQAAGPPRRDRRIPAAQD
jgi:hypothetical protein